MGKKGKEIIEKIHENYNYLNKMMVEEMEISSQHGGLTGDYREQTWIKLFRSIIPKKFSMAQGVIIIDSDGRISNEVDIAVYDEQYTPYVFQYNTLKFIPIEAVAVVIECKSNSYENNSLETWAEKIHELTPKASGIARMANGYICGITSKVQKRTRPIKILATIKKTKRDSSKSLEELSRHFDFIIQEQGSKNKTLKLTVGNEDETLGYWASELNGVDKEEHLQLLYCDENVESKKEEYQELDVDNEWHLKNTLKDLRIEGNEILTLNFQLNQLLMILNNPMLFPHYAYAKIFKEIIEDMKNKPN